MKKVLVTGAYGYIGSHIVRALYKHSYEPILVDNLSLSTPKKCDKDFIFYNEDISNLDNIIKILDTHKPDAVIHTAGLSSIAESVVNPHKYFCNNVQKLIIFMGALKEVGIKNFIYASSGVVYGNPLFLPITEQHPVNPLNPYAYTKSVVEQVVQTYEQAYGIKHVYLRFLNASGASLDGKLGEDHKPETHIIPLLIETAYGKRKKFIINGVNYDTKDGTVIRDYIHVDDIANAHIKALEYLLSGEKSEVFNLGTGSGYSVFDLIKKVSDFTGLNIEYEKNDRRKNETAVLILDYNKAKSVLGWEPSLDINDIISTAVAWFNRQNG